MKKRALLVYVEGAPGPLACEVPNVSETCEPATLSQIMENFSDDHWAVLDAATLPGAEIGFWTARVVYATIEEIDILENAEPEREEEQDA